MGNIDNQYQQIGRNIMKESQQEYWDPNTAEEDVWNDAKAFIRGVHDNQFEPKDMFEYGKKVLPRCQYEDESNCYWDDHEAETGRPGPGAFVSVIMPDGTAFQTSRNGETKRWEEPAYSETIPVVESIPKNPKPKNE